MKTIENLTVTMKFDVGFCGIEVPDEIYRGLEKISELFSISDSDIIHDKDIMEAFEWLTNHVHCDDALNLEYEVDIEE